MVAYVEGQGAVKLDPVPDFFAFMGATQIELAFITQADIKSYADVKGKVLAMDALYTGFAFVLYEMLAKAGLSKADYTIEPVGATPVRWEAVKAGKYAGTLTIEPFTSIARGQGFTVLDTSTKHYRRLPGPGLRRLAQVGGGQPGRAEGLHQGLSRRARVDARSGQPAGGDRSAA